MKRKFSIVLCFLLMLTSIYATGTKEEVKTSEAVIEPAKVEEAIETKEEKKENIVVYAKVPSDWSYPCIWAWDDAGVSAFPSWPGELMEPDPNNEGWYYIYLPASMTSVIVNANDGGIQTSDQSINRENAWLIVTEDCTVTYSKAKMTSGDIPEYTEFYKLYAQVDEKWIEPHVWAWEDPSGKNAFSPWPGRMMKPNANGWYSAKIPSWCNSIIVNGENGTLKTIDIKDLDPADMWISINEDGSFELTYEDPTIPKVENIKVNVSVPSDWQEPCVWAWSHPDGANAFLTWPGEPLKLEADGMYSLEIPGWINSIIINANGGTIQTSDLRVESGKNLSITVNSPDSVDFPIKNKDISM